ncbi:unnamed protein product [Penicillium glandicola]
MSIIGVPSVKPERTLIANSLEIPRMLNGLWQLAGGHDKNVDIAAAAEAMGSLIDAGLDGFDMADHYGDAELVIGQHHKTSKAPIKAFTKWCPAENGIKTFQQAEAAIDRALDRMGTSQVDLLQYHIWDYTDDTYLHNMSHLHELQKRGKIGHIGLTNTDAEHLELLIHSGFSIATNQVSCSVIDQRLVRGRLSEVCAENNVGVLAYGTLLGGFLSEKWVGAEEPQDTENAPLNWSLRKYLRFINAAGGWAVFHKVLSSLDSVAKKHGVPIAAVATRWVLDIPVVKAVIVGTRLSTQSDKYRASNLAAFSFSLDDEDRSLISSAQASLTNIPGDCGDEYRRAPFLTASGDLSDHVEGTDAYATLQEAIAQGKRVEYGSGSKWESIAGYSRAVRVGDTIRVSGTTANAPSALQLSSIGGSCARCQTVACLDIIARSLKKLGGDISNVVRTRIMIRTAEDCEGVSLAHGWRFSCVGIRPANTLTTAGLIGDEFLVEIEVEAVVGLGDGGVLCLT